jgi:predicted DsbA family dithiol-disulfide isomerase
MTTTFTVTYDYLCPFARIANETLAEMLQGGEAYDVRFAPFSLHHNTLQRQGEQPWDRPEDEPPGRGVTALLWSIAVRDAFPDHFLTFHTALFSARHDDGSDISDPSIVAGVARAVGIDADAVAEIVASGVPMKTLVDEHTALVDDFAVFGVPTFVSGEEAVFVRFMERHRPEDLRKVVDMLTWTNVNEFKRTRVDR